MAEALAPHGRYWLLLAEQETAGGVWNEQEYERLLRRAQAEAQVSLAESLARLVDRQTARGAHTR